MKRCPKCNREIESNSAFCEYCGHKVKRAIWPLFLVFGILLIGAASIVLINKSKNEAAKEEAFYQRCSTKADYWEYLSRYPDGKFAVQESENIQKMRVDSIQEAEALYREAEKIAFNNCYTAHLCRQYLKEFPNGSHMSEIIIKLEQLIQDSLKSLQPSINDDIDYRIHSFIESYSRLSETSDKQLIEILVSELFAHQVKRYFNAYDTDSEYVAGCFERYDETFSVYGKHSSVRWNTVSYTQSDEKIYLTYIEDFTIDRKDLSKYSIFVLEKHFELNHDFQIVSVYDVQLSKSKK